MNLNIDECIEVLCDHTVVDTFKSGKELDLFSLGEDVLRIFKTVSDTSLLEKVNFNELKPLVKYIVYGE